jgi:cyanophycin synthetase
VFEYPHIEVAVLEEYFGRIARLGFSFSWCNVAVCTNVTNDHLGRIGTHTLEQMAQVKTAVVSRARDAVVLNADDPHCLEMAARVSARKICLVSRLLKQKQLDTRLQETGCSVVLEAQRANDWIVIYDQGVRKPLIAVEDIPATFSGVAGHNTANAMHAAAACYLSGIGVEEISRGLASFNMGFESTPGRLNVHDGLPFRVIMDYAHNADGYRTLCEFVDNQPVTGRKIIMAAQSGDRQDRDIKAAVSELAGHFDHYVCRTYLSTRGRSAEEVPRLLKAGLLEAGVPETSISTVLNATEAIHLSLRLARAGDLLVLLVGDGGEIDSTWALLQSYEPPHSVTTAANALTK